jgi:hypothetical protein
VVTVVVAEVTEAVVVADVRTEVPNPAMDAAAVTMEPTVTLEAAMTLEAATAHAHCAMVAAAAAEAAAAEAAGGSVVSGHERRRAESNCRNRG